jgi:hypothetical protein
MTNEIVLKAMICSQIVLLVSSAGISQLTEVVDKVQITQSLAGVVRIWDPNSAGVRGVLVEECSSNWDHVLASTLTDDSGHFKLSNDPKRNLYYLRFSMNNMRTLLIKVKTTKRGSKELSIVLDYAT